MIIKSLDQHKFRGESMHTCEFTPHDRMVIQFLGGPVEESTHAPEYNAYRPIKEYKQLSVGPEFRRRFWNP